jgi:hypothetical protein
MKFSLTPLREHWLAILITLAILTGLGVLYLLRLGTLMPGLSHEEVSALVKPIGLHGIYNSPFFLPWKIVESAILKLQPDAGNLLVRLPSAFIGICTVLLFGFVLRMSHGARTTIMAAPLFATAAWSLHASRLATTDSMYFLAIPLLLSAYVGLQRLGDKAWVRYISLASFGLALYTPGLIWLILVSIYFLREDIVELWKEYSSKKQRFAMLIASFWWLPLLLAHFVQKPKDILLWMGIPDHILTGTHLLKQFVAVPVHMFVRGPEYPYIWLGKSPVLDILALIACLLGIYFYLRRLQAGRSKLMIILLVFSVILIGLGGPVQFSLVVPLLYLFAAGGIAYLLREWLQVFPVNPFARMLGIGLIAVAVVISCVYNVRAYYIAWPHNDSAVAAFHNRR